MKAEFRPTEDPNRDLGYGLSRLILRIARKGGITYNLAMRARSLFFLVVAASSIAYAGDKDYSLRRTITTVDAKVCKAFMKLDLAGFEKATRSVVTSDFRDIEMAKPMTYDEMLNTMKQSFGMISKMTSATMKIESVRAKGSVAKVAMVQRMRGTMVGPDKKTHKMTFTARTIDTWKKDGKSWKLAEMNWKSQKMTMDGKPFDPSKQTPQSR